MLENFSNPTDRFGFGESLPQQIAKQILKKIIEGELKAGDRILEDEISKELNTSRAPVREALYLLQVDGIVERIPRRGTVIKSFTHLDIVEYNDAMIGLIQAAVEFSKQKWQEEQIKNLHDYLVKATYECEQKNVINYQLIAEELFRYLFIVAENKALLRFYEEAGHILRVFAQSQWNEKTMESFHKELSYFCDAIINSQFNEAKTAIFNTLKLGVK
jgi:DNA-binding GntR family transcriptional regulator